jgi:hypothetical protein
MAQLLQVHPSNLHCTIKLCNLAEGADKKECKVYTIARSKPRDDRPADYHPKFHLASNASAFAALLGCNDAKNIWAPHYYCAFISNDLAKHERFVCDRPDWQSYYRAAAVFSIRYVKSRREHHTVIGFLTFDSLQIGIFGNVPETFEYKDAKRSQYKELLSGSAFYHVAGILADILAAMLYFVVEKEETRHGEHRAKTD